MKKVFIAVGLLLFLAAHSALGDTKNVVVDYGADPTGANDATPAFRLAMTQASTDKGMTLIVPAGRYKFAPTTADPAISSALPGTCVAIISSGVHIVGDALGDEYSASGTRIEVTVPGLSAFGVYGTSGGQSVAPSGTLIENLRISALGNAVSSSDGVYFDTASSYIYPHKYDTLRNLIIEGFANGAAAGFSTTSTRTPIVSLTVQSCIMRANKNCGLYVEDFDNLKIIGCEFTGNAGPGLYLRPYSGNSASAGGAFIQGCVMSYNSQFGLNCRGEQGVTTGNVIQNVHVTGCQMSNNGYQGCNVTEANNLEITNCTISGNNGTAGAAAINIGHCTGVSVIGCTVKQNYRAGFQISGGSTGPSTAVTVSSCTLSGNSAASAGAYAALSIANGANNLSFSNVTFITGGTQTLGIILQGNGTTAIDPQRILMQGFNFDSGLTTIMNEYNLAGSQTYMCEFYSPTIGWPATTTNPASVTYNGVMQYMKR